MPLSDLTFMNRIFLLCSLLTMEVLAACQELPAVKPLLDQAALGIGIQRTMSLLATSTPSHHNRVRILIYGQSITQQEWSALVGNDLR